MGGGLPGTSQADVSPQGAGSRFRLGSAAMALMLGGLVLALMIADVPLAALARQSLSASGGSVPAWVSAPFALVGFVIAWRKPANPLGWILLGVAFFLALSEDASYYAVADYRLRHGDLPLGWVALLVQPGWAPGIMLFGLTILLFPDGRPPSPRLRWMMWVFITAALVWVVSAATITVGAIIGHHTQVDPSGNLLLLGNSAPAPAWWDVVSNVFFTLGVACWLVTLAAQALSFPRDPAVHRRGRPEVPPVRHRPDHLPDAGIFDRHRPASRRVRRAGIARHRRAPFPHSGRGGRLDAGAVDLDLVRADLVGVVHQALEPVHVSVWVSHHE